MKKLPLFVVATMLIGLNSGYCTIGKIKAEPMRHMAIAEAEKLPSIVKNKAGPMQPKARAKPGIKNKVNR